MPTQTRDAAIVGCYEYPLRKIEELSPLRSKEINSIVEVHYTGKREFDSPEGERTMIEDTQGLLQTPARHMAIEYILRS